MMKDKFQDRALRDDLQRFVTAWLEANPQHAGGDYSQAAVAARDNLPYRLIRAAVRETLDYDRDNLDRDWTLDECPTWYVQQAVRETLLLAFEDDAAGTFAPGHPPGGWEPRFSP